MKDFEGTLLPLVGALSNHQIKCLVIDKFIQIVIYIMRSDFALSYPTLNIYHVLLLSSLTRVSVMKVIG